MRPPKLAQKIFSWYCRNELQDSILGDLDERFLIHQKRYGTLRAKLIYWREVLGFINRYTLKRESVISDRKYNTPMIRTNLITSFRFLRKHINYTSLNFLGLIIAFTSFLIILMHVNHETSFDKFHDSTENIYRINTSFHDNAGNTSILANTPPALVPGIIDKYPELQKASRLRYSMNCLLSNGDRRFYESKGFYADSLFLKIFDFKLSQGDNHDALDNPNTIVLTEKLAKKYFGEEKPLGKRISLNNERSLLVTGVIEEVPSNSHLDFDFLISFQTYNVPEGYASDLTSWSWLGFLTYVQLEDGSNPSYIEEQLLALSKEISVGDDSPPEYKLQPLESIYLGSSLITDDLGSPIKVGSYFSVYALMIIAIMILVVAGVNFSNLSNALAVTRSKSIGIRKVLGAKKGSLISQILMESTLITFLSTLMAYGLSLLVYPILIKVFGWSQDFGWIEVVRTMPFMILIWLLFSLSAGLYPAILLAGINLIKALKGQLQLGSKSSFRLNNFLLVFQFSISLGLIIATIIFWQQVNYLQNKSLGYQKENLVMVQLVPEDMTNHYDHFKETLNQNSGIMGVTRSDRPLGEPWPFSVARRVDESPEEAKIVDFNLVDFDYFSSMGIELLEGRGFSRDFMRDSSNTCIINQRAVSHLGLGEDPVGQQIYFFDQNGPRTVVGVVDDFNYTTLHAEIGPAVMILPFIDLEYMYIRLSPGDLMQKLDFIEDSWQNVSGDAPISWRLFDDKLASQYQSEQQLSILIRSFSVLAITLACLGLYGIVVFSVKQRIKEFGIRKVLGASVNSLFLLFVKPYFIQLMVALVLVTPLLIILLNNWLTGFAYRIEIQFWVFPFAGLIMMVLALATVSSQIIKTAQKNPVTAIKTE